MLSQIREEASTEVLCNRVELASSFLVQIIVELLCVVGLVLELGFLRDFLLKFFTMFVASADAFIFNAILVVDVSTHEMHGWQRQLLVAVRTVLLNEILRRPLHPVNRLPHFVYFTNRVLSLLAQGLRLVRLVFELLQQERLQHFKLESRLGF